MAEVELLRRQKGRPRNRTGEVVGRSAIDGEDVSLVEGYPWRLSSHGYANARVGNGVVYLHRLVMGNPDGMVDHINGDKLDNRKANLRVVDAAGNAQNRNVFGGRYSKHRGVTRNKRTGKWIAQARLRGKQVNIGTFNTEIDAARAASAWRRQNMPHAVETLESGL